MSNSDIWYELLGASSYFIFSLLEKGAVRENPEDRWSI